MRPAWPLAVLVAAVALLTSACAEKRPGAGSTVQALSSAPEADRARGRELVQRFECNRCHDAEGWTAATQDKHCVHCHQAILDDKFAAAPATLARWKPMIVDLRVVPTLTGVGARYRRDWVAGFLVEPYDLRPSLSPTMPRLPISREDARDIAAYLVPDEDRAVAPAGDPARGRRVLDERGCGGCHRFSGVAPLAAGPPPRADAPDVAPPIALAPDLRHAREQWQPSKLAAFLADPAAIKPDTLMPKLGLSEADARDAAAYVLGAELARVEPRAVPARLPKLGRKVRFDEVNEKVFHTSCWHCHSDADYAIGDGGPGNTGGLGFRGRGLVLATYAGVVSGSIDDLGVRRSVTAKMADGTPRLLAALLARQLEESGRTMEGMRGMPLGLPSLTPEQIQLVETWIDQGKPR